eukprot:UN06853
MIGNDIWPPVQNNVIRPEVDVHHLPFDTSLYQTLRNVAEKNTTFNTSVVEIHPKSYFKHIYTRPNNNAVSLLKDSNGNPIPSLLTKESNSNNINPLFAFGDDDEDEDITNNNNNKNTNRC